MKTMRSLKPKDRKIIKEMLDKVIELRTKELLIFERNITNQLRRTIQILKETEQNKYPIEYAIKINKDTNDYIRKFLNAKPKDY